MIAERAKIAVQARTKEIHQANSREIFYYVVNDFMHF